MGSLNSDIVFNHLTPYLTSTDLHALAATHSSLRDRIYNQCGLLIQALRDEATRQLSHDLTQGRQWAAIRTTSRPDTGTHQVWGNVRTITAILRRGESRAHLIAHKEFDIISLYSSHYPCNCRVPTLRGKLLPRARSDYRHANLLSGINNYFRISSAPFLKDSLYTCTLNDLKEHLAVQLRASKRTSDGQYKTMAVAFVLSPDAKDVEFYVSRSAEETPWRMNYEPSQKVFLADDPIEELCNELRMRAESILSDWPSGQEVRAIQPLPLRSEEAQAEMNERLGARVATTGQAAWMYREVTDQPAIHYILGMLRPGEHQVFEIPVRADLCKRLLISDEPIHGMKFTQPTMKKLAENALKILAGQRPISLEEALKCVKSADLQTDPEKPYLTYSVLREGNTAELKFLTPGRQAINISISFDNGLLQAKDSDGATIAAERNFPYLLSTLRTHAERLLKVREMEAHPELPWVQKESDAYDELERPLAEGAALAWVVAPTDPGTFEPFQLLAKPYKGPIYSHPFTYDSLGVTNPSGRISGNWQDAIRRYIRGHSKLKFHYEIQTSERYFALPMDAENHARTRYAETGGVGIAFSRTEQGENYIVHSIAGMADAELELTRLTDQYDRESALIDLRERRRMENRLTQIEYFRMNPDPLIGLDVSLEDYLTAQPITIFEQFMRVIVIDQDTFRYGRAWKQNGADYHVIMSEGEEDVIKSYAEIGTITSKTPAPQRICERSHVTTLALLQARTVVSNRLTNGDLLIVDGALVGLQPKVMTGLQQPEMHFEGYPLDKIKGVIYRGAHSDEEFVWATGLNREGLRRKAESIPLPDIPKADRWGVAYIPAPLLDGHYDLYYERLSGMCQILTETALRGRHRRIGKLSILYLQGICRVLSDRQDPALTKDTLDRMAAGCHRDTSCPPGRCRKLEEIYMSLSGGSSDTVENLILAAIDAVKAQVILMIGNEFAEEQREQGKRGISGSVFDNFFNAGEEGIHFLSATRVRLGSELGLLVPPEAIADPERQMFDDVFDDPESTHLLIERFYRRYNQKLLMEYLPAVEVMDPNNAALQDLSRSHKVLLMEMVAEKEGLRSNLRTCRYARSPLGEHWDQEARTNHRYAIALEEYVNKNYCVSDTIEGIERYTPSAETIRWMLSRMLPAVLKDLGILIA